jgi:hypothetical protein
MSSIVWNLHVVGFDLSSASVSGQLQLEVLFFCPSSFPSIGISFATVIAQPFSHPSADRLSIF